MAEVVGKHARPVGSQGWRLVWLNTWNDWQETTTFEPTADEGPKYPAGNYPFDMLEVVREVFGPETFARPLGPAAGLGWFPRIPARASRGRRHGAPAEPLEAADDRQERL